jgi:hypothetical protein
MNVYLSAKGKSHAHRADMYGLRGVGEVALSTFRLIERTSQSDLSGRLEGRVVQWTIGIVLIGPRWSNETGFGEIFVEHDSSRDVDDQVGSDKVAEMREEGKTSEVRGATAGQTGA